jgi:hypothetical protein
MNPPMLVILVVLIAAKTSLAAMALGKAEQHPGTALNFFLDFSKNFYICWHLKKQFIIGILFKERKIKISLMVL